MPQTLPDRYCHTFLPCPFRLVLLPLYVIISTMVKQMYFPPEAEVIVVRQEMAFLQCSVVGRADNGYDDNEMEEL